MVVSRIDNSVVYSENKNINLNDVKRESRLYQIMWNGLNIIIAVGSQKNTNQNITYFPIYLVKSNNSVIQIGLFEILTNKIEKYLDSKRALKIEKLGEPLIYTCITKKMVQQMRKIAESNIKDDELTDDEDEDPTELAEAAITAFVAPERLTVTLVDPMYGYELPHAFFQVPVTIVVPDSYALIASPTIYAVLFTEELSDRAPPANGSGITCCCPVIGSNNQT